MRRLSCPWLTFLPSAKLLALGMRESRPLIQCQIPIEVRSKMPRCVFLQPHDVVL